MKREMIRHPFPPLYDRDSRILILGSFPSVKSREQLFFYGHPQNRFWKVIAAVARKANPYGSDNDLRQCACGISDNDLRQCVRGISEDDLRQCACGISKDDIPRTIGEKKAFLHEHHIALWDVIASCTIEGSSDSSIRDVIPNDLTPILQGADIRAVFCNGGKSFQMYQKYQLPVTGRSAVRLPSTSPANAAWSAEQLICEWEREILPFL